LGEEAAPGLHVVALEASRRERLEVLGLAWDALAAAWAARIADLLGYRARFGHCRVPRRWKENPQLGKWVCEQRQAYWEGRMQASRQQRLQWLGFNWCIGYGEWEARLQELVEYRARFGHCNVPKTWEENRPLGAWVVAQRRRHMAATLDRPKQQRLHWLGFEWNDELEVPRPEPYTLPAATRGAQGEARADALYVVCFTRRGRKRGTTVQTVKLGRSLADGVHVRLAEHKRFAGRKGWGFEALGHFRVSANAAAKLGGIITLEERLKGSLLGLGVRVAMGREYLEFAEGRAGLRDVQRVLWKLQDECLEAEDDDLGLSGE